MIDCKNFYDELKKNDVRFFTGVPDSLLKNVCAYITDNVSPENHVITANEGQAIALAAGYHIASNELPLVYMQNSGQGNAVNPLVSLADPEVYSIPMLLLIGWRGEPGEEDEPQHVKQGKITLDLLKTLGIPFKVLSKSEGELRDTLNSLAVQARNENRPVALIVRKNTFKGYALSSAQKDSFELMREDAIKIIVDYLMENDVVVSTTGKASRELFEYREEKNQTHSTDFLTVGCMGHASQIALGIALQKKDRRVYCFDGDGAAIMHLGALTTIGSLRPENLTHILINNGAHDSVGGQPTAGFKISFTEIAKACGYKKTISVQTSKQLNAALKELRKFKGLALLEVIVNKGARKDLGRPTTTPLQNKRALMKNLNAL